MMHAALVTNGAENRRRNADTGYKAMEQARGRAGDVLAHLLADPPTATRREGRAMIRELTERIEDVIEATPIQFPLGIPQARIQALSNRVHRS